MLGFGYATLLRATGVRLDSLKASPSCLFRLIKSPKRVHQRDVTVKSTTREDELSPPADWQEYKGRWARPLDFSGESSAGGCRRALGRGPLADQLGCLIQRGAFFAALMAA